MSDPQPTKPRQYLDICGGVAVLVAFLILVLSADVAKADSRQANISKCHAERGIPVQSAASPERVVCISYSGKVLWVR